MTEKIVPYGRNILVKPDPKESRLNEHGISSGLTTEQEQRARGVVIGVGEDVKGIKEGDHVLYAVYAGEIAKHGTEEYRFLEPEDVVAFLR